MQRKHPILTGAWPCVDFAGPLVTGLERAADELEAAYTNAFNQAGVLFNGLLGGEIADGML